MENGAARAALNLMRRSLESVPPAELIDVYESSHHSIAELWKHFGERTAVRLLDGATVLAVLWDSVWSDTGAPLVIKPSELRRFYLDESWAPSVWLDEMRVERGELKIRLRELT